MHRFKRLLIPAILTSLIAIPVFAESGRPDHGDSIMGTGPEEEIFTSAAKDLGLSSEQNAKIAAVRDSGKREMHALRSEIRVLIWDLQDEVKKDVTDRKKLDKITDKICETEKKMMRHRSSDMLQIKSILTKEQFTKLLEKIESKKGRSRKNIFERMTNK